MSHSCSSAILEKIVLLSNKTFYWHQSSLGAMATGPINWLSQLRDKPKDHSIDDMNVAARDFTIFEIPHEIREVSPEDFKLFGLQLGLQHRSLQESRVQRLKLQLARILDAELKKNHASSWDAWVNLIVPDPEHARKLYESPSGCTDPADVQYQLALDSLFVVAFFQHKANLDALKEFEELFNTNKSQFLYLKSDFMQLENQVPMGILKAMTTRLCDIHQKLPSILPPKPGNTIERAARLILDTVLKIAVIYLHPFALPDDNAGGCVRWCFGVVEKDARDRWLSYLDKNYPAEPTDPDSSLSSCEHILACTYRVVCGHLLPPTVEVCCNSDTALRPMPSATDLKCIGIAVTNTALSLRDMKLSGKGYFRDARFFLPKLSVYENTALQFRNLGIYEQLANANCFDVRCYMLCMKYLTGNTADVDLLRKHGVLYSFVSNEEVLRMWDVTSKGLFILVSSKAWMQCFEGIHRHQKSWWKKWRAEGWSRFCSRPWLLIGLVSALLLLFLTFVQTWVSVVNAPHLKWQFVWS